jgi:hypothetical protein
VTPVLTTLVLRDLSFSLDLVCPGKRGKKGVCVVKILQSRWVTQDCLCSCGLCRLPYSWRLDAGESLVSQDCGGEKPPCFIANLHLCLSHALPNSFQEEGVAGDKALGAFTTLLFASLKKENPVAGWSQEVLSSRELEVGTGPILSSC